MNADEVIAVVRKAAGIDAREISISSDGGSTLLVLELAGQEFAGLAAKYGTEDKLLLRWLLPESDGNSCTVRDALSGRTYTAGSIFRRPEFAPGNHALNLSPDLDAEGSFAGSSWLRDVCEKWKRFAEDIKSAGECTLDNFIRLEAGLNAFFTSSPARKTAGFTPDSPQEDANPLLELEAKRQVLIDWPARTLGRLRIPHKSHRNRLCPFQTPESQRTGLQLTLAADAAISEGTIRAGAGAMFSAAVGLIPYPNHTDGPRLMMGGKNMKQAETGITGAEAPIVPGCYEGEAMRSFPVFGRNRKAGRFFPYLGLNALTVIMPFDGYTYEDGIVISESLAERLCIPEGHYRYSRVFDVVLMKQELEEAGITDLEAQDLAALFGDSAGRRCIYGDVLPEPRVKFYRDGRQLVWREKYRHHSPGVLESVKVKCTITGDSGRSDKDAKSYEAELSVSWNFRVVRRMGPGDKLTGRNGNKGVVTKILPDELMPHVHFKDEVRAAELVISPVSVTGRKNFGQIWEMAHSLLALKGGAKLEEFLDDLDVDIKNEPLDRIQGFRESLGEFLAETGCDESGLFRITCEGHEDAKAFAGWQYFCRLHHHAWKKLQARGGKDVPYSSLTGQPLQCGALTGQRMGEMENWSLLSHGAGEILSDMRRNYTGNFAKTRELLRKALRSLGVIMTETDSGVEFRARTEADDAGLKREPVEWASVRNGSDPFCIRIKSGRKDGEMSCRALAEDIRGRLKDGHTARRLDAVLKDECFFNPDGSIHAEPDIIRGWDMSRLLLQFCMNGPDVRRAKSLADYHEGLMKVVSGKNGLPRSYFARRRYDHSGRAVIVPEPSLMLHEAFIPAAMLIELLDGYSREYTRRLPERLRDIDALRRILNDYDERRDEARDLAGEFDEFLKSSEGELWCFMIRQPSLHRHSVQSFRLRCWEFPVIGIPPMVTPGFNADFDGDTMAVFLPPYDDAKDLRPFSVISNPGLVGTGEPALASGKDIALGWKGKRSLAEVLGKTASLSFEDRSRALQELQAQAMRDSYGAATLSPQDCERTAGSIGTISMMKDEDGLSIDGKGSFMEEYIAGNLWGGLSDDELFAYSYPSRYSMAQKKLSVAEAGYLSRLLAEKLYEYTVSIPDCGTQKGLEVSYKDGKLYVDGAEMPEADFTRVLWGRVLAGESECLDVEAVTERLKAGETVIVRSPLTCKERRRGHVCSACYGADAAGKPYGRPEPVHEGFAAGLTAAQAIGERGTQLAMKKFHDVGGSIADEVTVKEVRDVLMKKHTLSDTITKILCRSPNMKQALVHFEAEAAYTKQDTGFLSELAGERVSLLLRSLCKGAKSDGLSGIKSRLLWEGGDE